MTPPHGDRQVDDRRVQGNARRLLFKANAEKAKVKNERNELSEALNLLEAHLGTGTRMYDSEHVTRASRVRKNIDDKGASLCLEERSAI